MVHCLAPCFTSQFFKFTSGFHFFPGCLALAGVALEVVATGSMPSFLNTPRRILPSSLNFTSTSSFARSLRFPLDEDGIAELVRAIVLLVEFLVYPAQGCLICEGAQQIVMARAWLVNARQNCIDDTQPRLSADAQRRQALACPH